MTALWIVGAILLLLVLLLFLRVGAVLSFGEELRVTARAGPVRLTILPRPEKAAQKHQKKREKPVRKTENPSQKKDKKDKKLPLTARDILHALPSLFGALKAGLKKTRQRLRVDPLEISVVFGGDDPADAGELYGMATAAMFAVMPQLERLVRIPDPHIHLDADYTGGPTRAEGTVGLSFQIRDLLAIGWAFGRPVLKWYLQFGKQAAARAAQEKKDSAADGQPADAQAAS